MTIFVDTMLRGCFLAYFMSILKGYAILIPLIYVAVMSIAIIFRMRNENDPTLPSKGQYFVLACGTLINSGMESKKYKFSLRIMSKCIFSAIIMVVSIIILTTQSDVLFSDTEIEPHLNPTICANICKNDNQTEVERKEWENKIDYCNNIWMTVSSETNMIIWTVLGAFFVLSVIEGT